jgi:hypothetical protein
VAATLIAAFRRRAVSDGLMSFGYPVAAPFFAATG